MTTGNLFIFRTVPDSPQMTDKNVDSENELLVASAHSQPTMSLLEERLIATAYYKYVWTTEIANILSMDNWRKCKNLLFSVCQYHVNVM